VHSLVLWVQEVMVPALGPVGLLVVAFCDSSFLSLPEINDILIVTSASAEPQLAWLYVLLTTAGSLGGCSVLWWVGRRGGEPLLVRRFGEEGLASSRRLFRRWGILALAVPALLPPPMPFKIFVLSSGAFGFPYARFAATLVAARAARYTFWSGMGIAYGDDAIELLRAVDEWFLDLGHEAVLVGAALVAVGAALVLAWRARRRMEPR
jgi:membrane protein YqaA with SNARE-associated domain